MNKKGFYWTMGIIAALLVVLLIWLFFAGRNKTAPMPNTDTNTTQVTTNSSGADHANSNANSNTNSNAADQTDGNAADHSGMIHDNTNNHGDKNLASYLDEQDDVMEDMMEDMEEIDKTGYAAIDFLNGMLPHHEAAISMSQSYLKYGGANEELKKLANDIIDVQKQEIDQMQTLAKELKAAGRQDPDQENAYLEEYKKMFSSHQMNHSTANNVEAAFAEGMIMHHQMAVDMAESILKYTDEEQVISLAQNIITAQKEEIKQMENLLKEVN